MFDLTNYKECKKSIEKQLKEILPNWETTQGFISDGLFNPIQYSNSKLKILLILGEYYDHEKDGMIDISWQIEKGLIFTRFLGHEPKHICF